MTAFIAIMTMLGQISPKRGRTESEITPRPSFPSPTAAHIPASTATGGPLSAPQMPYDANPDSVRARKRGV